MAFDLQRIWPERLSPRSDGLQRSSPPGHWRGLTLACLAVLAGGFLLPAVVGPPLVDESRALAAAPPPPRSWAALKAWPKAMDAYVVDHFPARLHLIAGLNYLRYRLGVSGSERVLVGRDGWLFYDGGGRLAPARNVPAFGDADAGQWLQGLAGRTEWLRARGARYLVLTGPDKEVIEGRHGPAWYAGPDANRPTRLLSRLNAVAEAGEILDPAPALQQQARWGLAVYNPFETHWTGLGAYEAYVQVMQRLAADGVTEGPRPLDAFREVTNDPYKPRNLSLMLGIASFVDAEYPQFVDPAPTHTTWLSPKQDWTGPQVLDTGQAGKPVLLLVRDSFSNALLPFLQGHFSRIVLVHHQDGSWRPDLVDRFKPDVVISEVIESGLPFIMAGSPPASEAARARIDQALATPHRVTPRGQLPPVAQAAIMPPTRRIDGTAGPDVIRGTEAADAVNGRAGNDHIEGLGGDDVLHGGRGNDEIFGGDGRDWISGDLGDDILSGGRGADVFRIAPGFGNDRVTDFSAAEGDRVEVPRDVAYAVRQEGADTVIALKGARLVLRGVTAADLPAGWLIAR